MKRAKEIYAELETCTDDTRRLNLLFELATDLLNFDNKRSAEVAEEIGTLAKRVGSNLGQSFYHSAKARLLYRKSQFNDAASEFKLAFDMAMLTDDLAHQAICLDSLGITLRFQKKYKESENATLKAIEILETLSSTHQYIVIAHNNLGSLYKDMEEWDKAIHQYMVGLGIAQQNGDERMASNLLNNLSAVAIMTDRYKDATRYAQLALDGFRKLNHKNGEVHALAFVGHGNFGQGNYATAMDQYLACLKLLKNVDHKLIEAQAYKGLGNVYGKMQAYTEASKHYQKAREICIAVDDYKEACEIYFAEAIMLHEAGNNEKALVLLEKGLQLATEHHIAKLITLIGQRKEEWGY